MKKFISWLVYSSEDPKSVGLTFKGLALFALTEIAKVLSDAGIIIPETEISVLVIKTAAVVTVLFIGIGFVRKLINTFSPTEKIVVFKAKKSVDKKVAKKKKK